MNIYETAARRISSGRRTAKELLDYLVSKGFEREEAEEAVRSFKDDGYINDAEYAGDYFSYSSSKGWGKRRIFYELEKKGIPQEIISSEYEQYIDQNGDDDFDNAQKVIEKMISDDDFDEDGRLKEKAKARIARRMNSYGYSSEIIFTKINGIKREEWE